MLSVTPIRAKIGDDGQKRLSCSIVALIGLYTDDGNRILFPYGKENDTTDILHVNDKIIKMVSDIGSIMLNLMYGVNESQRCFV